MTGSRYITCAALLHVLERSAARIYRDTVCRPYARGRPRAAGEPFGHELIVEPFVLEVAMLVESMDVVYEFLAVQRVVRS